MIAMVQGDKLLEILEIDASGNAKYLAAAPIMFFKSPNSWFLITMLCTFSLTGQRAAAKPKLLFSVHFIHKFSPLHLGLLP